MTGHEASAYLRERHAIRRTAATLAKLARDLHDDSLFLKSPFYVPSRRDCSRFFSIAANDPRARNLRVKIARHDHSHCTRSLRIAGLGRDLFVGHRFALGNFFHDRAHTVRKALLFFRHRQPSIQPSSRNRCTRAAVRRFCAEDVLSPKNPMVGSFAGFCARPASGRVRAVSLFRPCQHQPAPITARKCDQRNGAAVSLHRNNAGPTMSQMGRCCRKRS
jgi:hypothetical protein